MGALLCITNCASRLIASGLEPEIPIPLCLSCKQHLPISFPRTFCAICVFIECTFPRELEMFTIPSDVAGLSETFPDPDNSLSMSHLGGDPPRPSSRRGSFSFFCLVTDSTRVFFGSEKPTPVFCLS